MKPTRDRLTDWVARGATDYAAGRDATPPDGEREHRAYLDGWRAAMMDEAERKRREAARGC